MFWFALPILAVGVGAWIYNSVSENERQAERRWKEKKAEVEKSLVEHRQNIEHHIKQAQSSYDFQFLVDMHYSSVKVADAAYKLLVDSRDSISGINKMLNNAKQRKTTLENELQIARNNKNKSEIHSIISELKVVNELRKELFLQKDNLLVQKNSFFEEVKRLNIQTSELKQYIRHRCGIQGLEWYQRLENRKLSKKSS